MTIPVWRALFFLVGALNGAASWAAEDLNTLARALLKLSLIHI